MSSKRDAAANESGTQANQPIGTLNYKSFLVRIWREDAQAPWRASITHIPTQETETFLTIQALLLYLHEQVTAV